MVKENENLQICLTLLYCLYAAYIRRSAKIFILILEGIIKTIYYERRDYESENEKSLWLGYVPKRLRKNILGSKGLRVCFEKDITSQSGNNIFFYF